LVNGRTGWHDEFMSSAKTMVLVDDEVDFRASMAMLFQAHGYIVYEAASAIDGWKLLQDVQPDVVVTDLMMPHMSGLDLCRRVRADAKLEALPIVMLSAAPAPTLGYGVWVDRYLTKPAPFEAVLLAVEEVLSPPEGWAPASRNGQPAQT
jgi:DNA-binding response OmpR family regulator